MGSNANFVIRIAVWWRQYGACSIVHPSHSIVHMQYANCSMAQPFCPRRSAEGAATAPRQHFRSCLSSMQMLQFVAGLVAGLVAMLFADGKWHAEAVQAKFIAVIAAAVSAALAMVRSQQQQPAASLQNADGTQIELLAKILLQLQQQSKQFAAAVQHLDKLRTAVQHLEWRSMLVAEARWSGESLQATYRRWQAGVLRMPPMANQQSTTLDCGALMGPADEAVARRELDDAVVARDSWQWSECLEAEHALEEMEAADPGLRKTWQQKKAALQAYEDAVKAGGREAAPADWKLEDGSALFRIEQYLQMSQPPKQPLKKKGAAPAAAADSAAGSAGVAALGLAASLAVSGAATLQQKK